MENEVVRRVFSPCAAKMFMNAPFGLTRMVRNFEINCENFVKRGDSADRSPPMVGCFEATALGGGLHAPECDESVARRQAQRCSRRIC